jgi:hypothetical protein
VPVPLPIDFQARLLLESEDSCLPTAHVFHTRRRFYFTAHYCFDNSVSDNARFDGERSAAACVVRARFGVRFGLRIRRSARVRCPGKKQRARVGASDFGGLMRFGRLLGIVVFAIRLTSMRSTGTGGSRRRGNVPVSSFLVCAFAVRAAFLGRHGAGATNILNNRISAPDEYMDVRR